MVELAIVLGFGGLGGVGQGLLASQGVLCLPHRKEAAKIDLGALSDLFVGALGGLGSIVLASALLTALNPALLSAGGDPPSSAFGALSPWLMQASFGVLTGFAGRRLLPAVSDRITKIIQESAKDAAEGQAKKAVVYAADQMSTVMDQMSAIAGSAAVASAAPAAAVPAANRLDRLAALCEAYEQIQAPTWEERVRMKDEGYRDMTQEILARDISADEIFHRIQRERRQGWVLALCALASARPAPGLAKLLLESAHLVTWKHVMYRLASAIGILAARGAVTKEEAKRTDRAFAVFADPDPSLARKFEATRALLRAVD